MLANHSLKIKKQYKNLGDSQYIYQSELDEACFQHDIAYGDFKNLTRRKDSDKILRIKHLIIQRGLASIVYTFFEKNSPSGSVKNKIMPNQELAEKLRKPIIKKFDKRKLYASFKENIWGVDLVDIQLISKFNKEF